MFCCEAQHAQEPLLPGTRAPIVRVQLVGQQVASGAPIPTLGRRNVAPEELWAEMWPDLGGRTTQPLVNSSSLSTVRQLRTVLMVPSLLSK
jgi:hypothetical protein